MEAKLINQLSNTLNDLEKRSEDIRVYTDYQGKKDRSEEVIGLSEDPELWNDPKHAREIDKERKILKSIVLTLDSITSGIKGNHILVEMAVKENDKEGFTVVQGDVTDLEKQAANFKLERTFDRPIDPNDCSIGITAGMDGTEAEDWTDMLFHTYSRYAERKGSKVEILEEDDGEIVDISRVTVRVKGEYAYGLLRIEAGVHHLVRCSLSDSNDECHTLFSSAFVYPKIDDSTGIEVNPTDLRVGTYRASGADGQHTNRTDSAIRITHEPMGTVVQCQSDRSQHTNKATAMEMLKSKLYELEMHKHNEEKQTLGDGRSDVGWGSQVRSYVSDSPRVKGLRTGYEVGNVKVVLDGDLDGFIEAGPR